MTPATAVAAPDDLRVRGRAAGASRWATAALLAVTAAAHLVRPTTEVVGSAVTAAGARSWTAWLSGTLDARAATPVGAPAAQWVPGLLARVVDPGPLPGTALGVLAVALVVLTARRSAPAVVALAAGAVVACLPADAAHTTPAVCTALAGWSLTRHRPGRAGLALGGAVLSAGTAGALAVPVALVLLARGRRAVPVLRLLLGAVAVVGTWALLVGAWPGPHPRPTWDGSVAGALVPALALLGAAAARHLRRAVLAAVCVTACVTVCVSAGAARTSPAVTAVGPDLARDLRAAGTPWSAVAVGDERSAALELATGTSVLPARSLTLAGLQSLVATGRVRYFVVDGPDGSDVPADLLAWVRASRTPVRVDGSTVYDLSG